MDTATEQPAGSSASSHPRVARIAVGVDGFREGEDAAALGKALAEVTGADLLLVTVHSEPLILPPVGVNWTSLRQEAQEMLHKARTALAPGARTAVETDVSVPRALHRVVIRERRDLLVMGSSRGAPEGRVRIGKRTRQLLCNFECPLAIAPRGYRAKAKTGFSRIGVGYDGGEESQAALALAATVAAGAGAELDICAVVDDRTPPLNRGRFVHGSSDRSHWEDAVQAEIERRRSEAEAAAVANRAARGKVEIRRGRPADALLELSTEVDLLVIGSRRWGPVARLLLGTTGEALLHDAVCPVLVVPRPTN